MIIVSDWLVKKGFKGMAIYPFIFVKKKEDIYDEVFLNHERIHLQQQKELMIAPFYALYLKEFLQKGYRNISFEREAYENEHNLNYLDTRPPHNYKKYR